MAFIELKKTQKTRDIGSPKSNAAVTDIKSSISRTLDRISSLDTTASNINRSLYNLSEARKVQDMVADMAYLRMNHMDKILSSNFSDR